MLNLVARNAHGFWHRWLSKACFLSSTETQRDLGKHQRRAAWTTSHPSCKIQTKGVENLVKQRSAWMVLRLTQRRHQTRTLDASFWFVDAVCIHRTTSWRKLRSSVPCNFQIRRDFVVKFELQTCVQVLVRHCSTLSPHIHSQWCSESVLCPIISSDKLWVLHRNVARTLECKAASDCQKHSVFKMRNARFWGTQEVVVKFRLDGYAKSQI